MFGAGRGSITNVACRAERSVGADGLARFDHACQTVGAISRDPGADEVDTFVVAGSERECFGSDAILVGSSRTCAGLEKNADNVQVAVGGSKVKRGGTLCAWA